MLALPTDAGLLGKRLLHHGRSIDEYLHVAAAMFHEPARDRFQPRLDDLVIVVAARIDGNRAAVALLKDREWVVLIGSVIEPEHDDGSNLAPQDERIAAPFDGRLKP